LRRWNIVQYRDRNFHRIDDNQERFSARKTAAMPPESSNSRPIFYDESRKRWSWISRLSLLGGLLFSIVLVVFVLSMVFQPLLPHRPLPQSEAVKDLGNVDPILTDRQKARSQFALRRDSKALIKEREREQNETKKLHNAAPKYDMNTPITLGFYVNWEETSLASLRRNVHRLTHFCPEWLHITKDGKGIIDGRNQEDRLTVTKFVRDNNLPIIPLINNYIPQRIGSEQSQWDANALHLLLSEPKRRAVFIQNLVAMIKKEGWQGINIDFEQVPEYDRDNLTALMTELSLAFRSKGLILTQDVQVENASFDLPALAEACDFIIPMLYDQHSPGQDGGGAGSIAGIPWYRERLKELFAVVPADKVVLGLGNYAYDWKDGEIEGASINYQAAVVQAKESFDPQDPLVARITLDPKSLNPFYSYFDDEGARHTVWMLDAASLFNHWRLAYPYKPRGAALWYLGSEDPGVWNILGRRKNPESVGQAIDMGVLNHITYGKLSQVDFEGEGELLSVVAEPTDGNRTLRREPKTGLITTEVYHDLPSGYVVRRSGFIPKKLVLTFDDGPDPNYTPQILDILKQENVPATFFIVGSQGETNPGLVRRIWDEGHELGNHTFSHPDLSQTGDSRTLLEISATQRLIETLTGHTTTLFRPPYAIDVEPRTAQDLKPIMLASRYNFISVGEQIDPQDWNEHLVGANGAVGAARIVEATWEDRDKGSVILLHDGGGDRTHTLEALPLLIRKLKAAGYQFTTISELRGLPRATLFPKVTGREGYLVGMDRWVFEGTFVTQKILYWLFTLSIFLGVSRQVLMTLLALMQRQREARRIAAYPLDFHLPVSVVIAAYNEERVITRTIQTVLDSVYFVNEVIVVDDGSKDSTYDVVAQMFANNPRVRAFRKENGGKASALNYGMQYAEGEIIVALDADTLFVPDTIGRLARHFADPKVGAVAGNVRVGNANNILTKWQALEYITSQNFDRRAYDLLNSITVVPGAVGAWRTKAIEQAGGYTHDTLAEDADLTWTIRETGWRIVNDSTAYAYTEAPDSLKNLSHQRFRWAFGTLQNLWKHRSSLGKHGTFGWFAMPSLWVYQIVFPAISPIMDLTVVWALLTGHLDQVAYYYALMMGVEFAGAALAVKMDKADWKLLPYLFLQRFVYRQLMYYVILKSVFSALRGGAVGWNKFERRGTARVEGQI